MSDVPMIGTTLGRYRIVAKLGEGGMGSVWRAEDPALGRTVALKLLAPALLGSDEARQRFLREARAASGLRHPNIATVFDVGEGDGGVWIACEFVDGESVAARCAAGPLPIPDAVTVARETAAALAHAHERGVLHRDVTAGNVMVTRDGHAVLVDFGLARVEAAAQLTQTGATLGTAGYLAPEVLRGASADARSDLYGLGAVLYKLLTGQLPFEGGPAEAMLYRVLNERVPPPSEVRPETPPALERVVLKLLEREPVDRYASAAEAESALVEAESAAGPSAADLRRRALARRWRRWSGAMRRLGRTRVGVASLATLALLTAATWFAAQRGWLPWTQPAPPVIAVLPFENTSETPEDAAYLGEGLGDEMVLKLGQTRSFHVLPWATTRSARQPGEDLRQVARRLGADILLVGTFRAYDERVRVTASLVSGRSGVQRWSHSFDELLTDLMSVQAGIATGVTAEISGRLGAEDMRRLEQRPSASPEAYALYLEGSTYLNSADENMVSMAAPFFEKAIEADPALAEAHVGLGATKLDRYFRGDVAGLDVVESAETDMRRALELRPGTPRALLGLIKVAWLTGRSEDCLWLGEIAAKRGDEDIQGLLIRGWAGMLGGLPDVAVPVLDRVLELDRNNREAAWCRVVSLAWSERYANALERGKEFIRTFGEDPEIFTWMGASASAMGDAAGALAYYDRSLVLFGDSQSNLYSALQSAALRVRVGDRAGGLAAAELWRERLTDRLALTPDNDRVLSMLLSFESILGDTAAVRVHAEQVIELVRSPRPDHANGPALALRALCRVGEVEQMGRLLAAMRAGDPLNWHMMLRDSLHTGRVFLGPCPALDSLPEYLELLRAVEARAVTARAHYAPILGLRGTRELSFRAGAKAAGKS